MPDGVNDVAGAARNAADAAHVAGRRPVERPGAAAPARRPWDPEEDFADADREDSDPGHALDLDDLRDAYQD